MSSAYVPSDAAKMAGDYFNSLPREQRAKLAPLLEHHRQMGLAEARKELQRVLTLIDVRVREIRTRDEPQEITSGCGGPLERESGEWTVCPDCGGVPQMAGDGSGWDGSSYHTPPCGTCDDRGKVLAS